MLLFAYHAGEVKVLALAHLYWLAIASEAWSLKPLINETKRRFHSAETNDLDKKAIRKAKEFLQNLRGIVFYAVPHSGADAATLLSYFQFVRLSKIIGNLKPFSRRMAKMSVMMQDTFYNKGINIYAFGEGKPTY
jgi:hypothetical protein